MKPEIETLCEVVAEHYQVNPQDIRDKRRSEKMTYIRNMFVHIAREYLGLTYSEIGRYMNRDHTSVKYLHNAFRPDEIIAEKIDMNYQAAREIDAVDNESEEGSEFEISVCSSYAAQDVLPFKPTAYKFDEGSGTLTMIAGDERAYYKLAAGDMIVVRKV